MACPKGVKTKQEMDEMLDPSEYGRDGRGAQSLRDGILSAQSRYQCLGGPRDGLFGRNDSRF